ncbi:AarF/ABC1/UbiB kinase family protein [Aldersonia sp. NBC_00410]|uniref:ABC1 kinase family protein n=1 Tax=Aldersonia sp. NBC_00410 TaxID=2975954 RepID=UPI00225C00A5|nr:AarF/ABC1/UbiB kinase family protein [Aldersonia sp. NBC_00410]MCX5041833.1 AarF/ABC1/UbiB kinase family protein [Aldersonia sp. NBC_00410]
MPKQVPTSRLARGSKLGAAAAGQVLRSGRTRMAMVGRSERVREQLREESTVRAAEQLVTVLGGMKGIAMKLGQMLSVLDLDLVPPEHREAFQQKLAVLRDSAPTVPFADMRAVLEADLGRPISELFAEFEDEPIAAASIGQVYRARLHDGRTVAVKVQYPGIDTAVRADLRNLVMLRRVLQSAVAWVTPALIDELARNLENELDYRLEASTHARIAGVFRGHPFIAVPPPIPELCSTRVLVSEYFPGIGFAGIRELPQHARDRIGEIVYRFYIGSLFSFDEFCGDPHPGNVLLGADGRVAFIDFGLFNKMDPALVDFELACLRAAAEDRGEDLHRLWRERGVFDSTTPVSVDECLDYVYAASEWCLVDQALRVTPELASGAFLLAIDPRATEFVGMKQQNLPPEHLFSRRADFLTFGVLGQLEACANWHRIAREWMYGDEPATELGRAHRQWLDTSAPRSVRKRLRARSQHRTVANETGE